MMSCWHFAEYIWTTSPAISWGRVSQPVRKKKDVYSIYIHLSVSYRFLDPITDPLQTMAWQAMQKDDNKTSCHWNEMLPLRSDTAQSLRCWSWLWIALCHWIHCIHAQAHSAKCQMYCIYGVSVVFRYPLGIIPPCHAHKIEMIPAVDSPRMLRFDAIKSLLEQRMSNQTP